MSKVRFSILLLILSALLIAGCGTKQAPDTKAPSPAVGIVDMKKTVNAHPKYNQLMELEKQAKAMAAQVEAQQLAAARQAQSAQSLPNISQSQMAEQNKGFEQEFAAKMSAKQDELSSRVNGKADEARRTLTDELNAYNNQLEKEYQPRLFNLQLKLKTVQLTTEEANQLQAELQKLQNERSQAIAAKQKQLELRMDELMAPEKAALEEQLAAYAKQLNEEISNKAAAKQAEITARNNNQQMPATADQGTSQIQQQLVMKQQEIQALQGFIMGDITDKTAKVAVASGLEAVLTNVTVNVSAMDITALVIAECNK